MVNFYSYLIEIMLHLPESQKLILENIFPIGCETGTDGYLIPIIGLK